MATRVALMLALLSSALACGGGREPDQGQAADPRPRPEAPAPPLASAARSIDAAPTPPAPAPLDAETRKRYREHLHRGRALAAAERWSEAAAAFEAALEVIPRDGRALSELGWAAFQAGDHDRAREANALSVRVADDDGVRAASLYNLGRVDEARGRHTSAAALYERSLALRESRVVASRLKALASRAPAPADDADTGVCGREMARDALCACLDAADGVYLEDPQAPRRCDVEATGVAGIAVARVAVQRSSYAFLAAEVGDGWNIVAALGSAYEPGIHGHYESLDVDAVRALERGGRRLVWIETRHEETTTDSYTTESRSQKTRIVTVCVVPKAREESVRCPLQVPVELVRFYAIDLASVDPEAVRGDPALAALAEARPHASTTTLELTIDEEGVARVILRAGPRTDAVAAHLGPHPLW